MSVLLLDMAVVEKTWSAIVARIARRPTFQVVPEEALVTIENVILANEEEAWDRFPDDQKCRVQVYKEALLDAVPAEERGLWAVYFHEYIASTLRCGDAAIDDDDVVYFRRSSSPAIAQRALSEAYKTCSAGLDSRPEEWNS